MAKFERLLTDSESGDQAFIKSNDYFIFQQKIEKQLEKWRVQNIKGRGIDRANLLTEEAKKEQASYKTILQETLDFDDKIDWESMKDKTTFHKYVPQSHQSKESFFASVPNESWIEKLIPYFKTRRLRLEQEANQKFSAHMEQFSKDEDDRLNKYNTEKTSFEDNQNRHNAEITKLKTSYESGDPKYIETYINMVLENSKYPDSIQLEHSIEYVTGSMVLKVTTFLPNVDDLNFLSEAKYIPSKGECQLKQLQKGEVKSFYADILNQIVLRTLHEIFEAEHVGHIQRVEFVGINQGTDPKTGQDSKYTYLKVGVERSKFTKIDLSKVDYEACLVGLDSVFAKESNNLKRKAA